MRIFDSIESIAILNFIKDKYITYSNILDRNLQYMNSSLNNESHSFGFEIVNNSNQEIDYLKDSRSESIASNIITKKSVSKRNLSNIKDIYTFTFMQLRYLKLYIYWINNALLPTLYDNDERTLLDQNYIIGDPQLFFGVRAVNYFNNTDNYTNKIFPQLITTKTFTVFDSIGSDSYNKPLKLNTGKTYYYINEGDYSTFYGGGGYLFPYPRNKTFALKMNYLSEYNILDLLFSNFYYTFILVNRNNKNVILIMLETDTHASGEQVCSAYFYTIRSYYSTQLDWFRFFLEIVYL